MFSQETFMVIGVSSDLKTKKIFKVNVIHITAFLAMFLIF